MDSSIDWTKKERRLSSMIIKRTRICRRKVKKNIENNLPFTVFEFNRIMRSTLKTSKPDFIIFILTWWMNGRSLLNFWLRSRKNMLTLSLKSKRKNLRTIWVTENVSNRKKIPIVNTANIIRCVHCLRIWNLMMRWLDESWEKKPWKDWSMSMSNWVSRNPRRNTTKIW